MDPSMRWKRRMRPIHIPVSEEYLTTYNLLALRKHNPDLVKVAVYKKGEEGGYMVPGTSGNRVAGTGADWEWWLGSGKKWRALRVQAKIVSMTKANQPHYAEIAHPDHSWRQLSDLINGSKSGAITPHAAKSGAIDFFPVYAFYNFWKSKDLKLAWGNPTGTPDPHPYQLQGCAIAAASHIASVRGKPNWRTKHIFERTIPWHGLVCPHFSVSRGSAVIANPTSGSLVDRVTHVLERVLQDYVTGAPSLLPKVQTTIPKYVYSMISEEDTETSPQGRGRGDVDVDEGMVHPSSRYVVVMLDNGDDRG